MNKFHVFNPAGQGFYGFLFSASSREEAEDKIYLNMKKFFKESCDYYDIVDLDKEAIIVRITNNDRLKKGWHVPGL